LTRFARSAPAIPGVPRASVVTSTSSAIGREVDHDLPVEATRTHERGIENIGTIGGGDEDYPLVRFETIHLHQKLIESLLALVVTAAQPGAAMAPDRVDLVDEDDARRMGLALLEQVADPAGAYADEHLDEIGAGHREEWPTGFAGNGSGKQGLTRSGRPNQERTLRQAPSELCELLGILQELDDLLELDLRFVGSRDVIESHLRSVPRQQLRFRLPEAESFRPARLHGTEEEEPDSDNQKVREETDQNRRQ
jgi:hypothetical protein